MSNSRILEKIQKCMALAESDNKGEAAAALRQAQKLMAKHNLEASDLELHTVSEAQAGTYTRAKVPPLWVAGLRGLIADVFGVKQIWQAARKNGQWRNRVVYIGVGEKPQAARYCYEVLYRQIARDRDAYLGSLPSRLKRASKTKRCQVFCEAWIAAVYSKVEAMAMPDSDEQLIKRYRDKTFGDLPPAPHRAISKKSERNREAAALGYESGANAQLFHGVPTKEEDRRLAAGVEEL